MNFLRYYVRFSDPGNNSIFEQELQKLTGRSNTMGIEELLLDRAKNEGEAKGRHAERTKSLKEKKTIARKFKNKGIDINTIAEATGLTIQEIERL
ncbi:hypothetical protein [Pedobacter heparinus]|uniref:Uncharacterized protein n=1 Tax=Pedobacter heparinus (strain ATCC 13125 / DSM 2366 / CIP 104194 / JCM 7457 / NBRC 12017 / NCIMB 9290 / NRRL B-14731 / HIM 762-3) TaxID=485917 RepID=C6XV99_PEDHD|nr:hypothetical protein [Pedobacter heparinus]ACU03965.1 hypothetical protein Phep_1756 [Pedobacter heparinus DSM 2366]